jgi:hypothetical protein
MVALPANIPLDAKLPPASIAARSSRHNRPNTTCNTAYLCINSRCTCTNRLATRHRYRGTTRYAVRHKCLAVQATIGICCYYCVVAIRNARKGSTGLCRAIIQRIGNWRAAHNLSPSHRRLHPCSCR